MAIVRPSSTRRGKHGRTPMAEINVTPLVDVMLVLLIVFMVTAPLLTAGVPVELPESRAKALDQEAQQVTLSLDGSGRLFVDNVEITRGQLSAQLAGIPRDTEGKPPPVVLRADRGLDYGRVMALMGELNRAGFNTIQLVTSGSSAAP